MSHNAWNAAEDILLKQLFPTTSTKQISDKIGRSYEGIRQRAKKLNLKKENRYWTPEEVQFLKVNYQKIKFNELRHALQKSRSAIFKKLKEITNPTVETAGLM